MRLRERKGGHETKNRVDGWRYKEGGLGGIHIVPIYGAKGAEARYLDYLSPRWMEMFAFAVDEAAKLDLGVDLTTGSGWCFGGPCIAPDLAGQKAVVTNGAIRSFATSTKVKRATGTGWPTNSMPSPAAETPTASRGSGATTAKRSPDWLSTRCSPNGLRGAAPGACSRATRRTAPRSTCSTSTRWPTSPKPSSLCRAPPSRWRRVTWRTAVAGTVGPGHPIPGAHGRDPRSLQIPMARLLWLRSAIAAFVRTGTLAHRDTFDFTTFCRDQLVPA